MTYKGFLLASAGGLAAASGGAQAADLPTKAPMIAAPVAANWAGFYVGLHAGAAWQDMSATNFEYGSTTVSGSSFIGGGQIGYNWQHGNFVYGVEADVSGLSHGPRVEHGNPGKGNLIQTDLNWLSTYRARAGLAVGDTMAYVTGGLAVGGVKNKFFPTGTLATDGASKSQSRTQWGWAFGGGIEHMWTQHWSIALEGLFVDLGNNNSLVDARSIRTGTVLSNDTEKRTKFKNQYMIGRVKVNYKW